MTTVKDFEVVDIGIQYPDYFIGFGCANTSFYNSAYGVGNSAKEAVEDCLEIMYNCNVDVEEFSPRLYEVTKDLPAYEVADDDDGAYYCVGIRWNAE